MAEADPAPANLEPVATGVCGTREADKPLERPETPSRDNPDAGPGVASQAGQARAGAPGEARGMGMVHERRERAIDVREQDQGAASL